MVDPTKHNITPLKIKIFKAKRGAVRKNIFRPS